ncbi:MAG: response regulator [Candidatus Marinimicrobia bacterium]|nr:response regulator [Candidatus Neomarinimicrobiota bacterium]
MNQSNNSQKKQVAPIIVIDDDESILEFFRDVFNEMDLIIDTETDGMTGISRILEEKYELVFLDVMLRDMNGIKVLKAVKAANKDINVIMISGYLTEEVIEQALSAGADGYLYKPLSVMDVLSKTIKFMDPETMKKIKFK